MQERSRKSLVARVLANPNSTFWREDTAWPYVHSVLPAALYVATRSALVSLLLIYVWESLEQIGAFATAFFVEKPSDSLIGDIAQGSLAIALLWLIDQLTGWDVAFCATVPVVLRVVALVVAALASFASDGLVSRDHKVRYGVLLYGALYVVVGVALYVPPIIAASDLPEQRGALLSVGAWLLFALLQTVVGAIGPAYHNASDLSDANTVFVRTLFTAWVLTTTVAVAVLVALATTGRVQQLA